MVTEQNIQKFSVQCKAIFEQLGRDVIGMREVVEGAVVAMIAGGNVLLEGVPGVGKTRLVRSLGRVFSLPFSRIQFTPDLMPADVTGTNIIVKDETGNSTSSFQPGPIFSNIILADEINRATPKTQSALLEAMQEHTVTVMGVSRKLNEPFFVLATQKPDRAGRYLSASRSADGPLHVQADCAQSHARRADADRRHDAEDDGGGGGSGLHRRGAARNACDGKPDPRRGRSHALCDAAMLGHSPGQRMRFGDGEKVRPPRRKPPCGTGAHFGRKGQSADERALQRCLQRRQRARLFRCSVTE